ncbi:hypothetical protein Bca101_056065 [Brassica carinata]
MGSNSSTAASPEVSTIVKHWREHPPSSYSLMIHNFSELEKSTAFSDHKYESRLFSCGGYNWRLIIYPKGNGEDNQVLPCVTFNNPDNGYIFEGGQSDSDKPEADEKIFVQASFRVLNPLGSKHFEYQLEMWCTEQIPAWGWSQFLSLAELPKVYLDKEDTLKVEVEFKVVSAATKYSEADPLEEEWVQLTPENYID